jgi:hypothetical protein
MRRAFLILLLVSAAQAEEPITQADREHWSFTPPVRPPVPAGEDNAIDYFILAKLKEKGLDFAPAADRRTLLRRVTFDLTGLPPTPEELESPDSYEMAVDRLLASTAYGERWAQHWLDVARFAESDGFEHDKVREDAWRYRDWVIDALNADMPYDRFVQLQLAADEIAPDDESAQAATGFLLAGPDMPDINLQEERKHNFLNGMAATIGEAFYALTLGCAQCHDHRTDPVSTDDFYRLRAIFANAIETKRDKQLGHQVRESGRNTPENFVMTRGDFSSPGTAVEPAFLRVFNPNNTKLSPPKDGASSSMRRAEFARWVTRPEHPLTARVIVNRLWQHHFGTGIVPSSGDFGITGEAPSNPDLLDWLATELPAQGWSLKKMHRQMVTSRTYRQSHPGMQRRRLEGEVIRDAFLAISGELNRDAGGPSVLPPLPNEITSTLLNNQWKVTKDEAAHRRRSIYIFTRRNLRYPVFDVFDRPDSNMSCSRRGNSTTAPQALMLLNSEFSLSMASALARRLEKFESNDQRIQKAYTLIFSRPPKEDELALGLDFLSKESLTHFCLALLNTNEAIYLD